MDDQIEGFSWVDDVVQKMEALCLEFDDAIDVLREEFRFVQDELQTVGASVRQFYFDLLIDVLPQSTANAENEVTPDIDVRRSDASEEDIYEDPYYSSIVDSDTSEVETSEELYHSSVADSDALDVDTDEEFYDPSIEKNAEVLNDEQQSNVNFEECLVDVEHSEYDIDDFEDAFSCIASTILSFGSAYSDGASESEVCNVDVVPTYNASVEADDNSMEDTTLGHNVTKLSNSLELSDSRTPEDIVMSSIIEAARESNSAQDVVSKLRAANKNTGLYATLFAAIDNATSQHEGNDIFGTPITSDYEAEDPQVLFPGIILNDVTSEPEGDDVSASLVSRDPSDDLLEAVNTEPERDDVQECFATQDIDYDPNETRSTDLLDRTLEEIRADIWGSFVPEGFYDAVNAYNDAMNARLRPVLNDMLPQLERDNVSASFLSQDFDHDLTKGDGIRAITTPQFFSNDDLTEADHASLKDWLAELGIDYVPESFVTQGSNSNLNEARWANAIAAELKGDDVSVPLIKDFNYKLKPVLQMNSLEDFPTAEHEENDDSASHVTQEPESDHEFSDWEIV